MDATALSRPANGATSPGPELLYVGALDAHALLAQVRAGRAPAQHLHAVPLLGAHGIALRTLPASAQTLRRAAALDAAVWGSLRPGATAAPPAMVLAHSHLSVRGLALRRRLGRMRTRLAAFVHSMAPRPWDRLWMQGFDLLLPLSRCAERQLQALRLRAQVRRVPYGADLDFYDALTSDPDPASSAPRDLVLSVGVSGRDFGTLIDAAPAIDLPVHLVGRVDEAQRAAATHRGVSLHSKGHYDLPFDELRALYRRAACVVVATHGSAHPYGVNALVEAMAMACPVVVTEGEGLDLDPAAEGFGLRVPPHRPQALADAVNRITRGTAQAQAMGARARAVAQSQASARVMAREISAALWSLLPAPQGAAAQPRPV